MNAGQATRLVGPFIGADENANARVWEVLRLACNHAWSKGKWWGMTGDFEVQVFREHGPNGKPYILSPPGYDTLLAINSEGKPRTLRDSYFMFHRNGPGDIKDSEYCNWNQDVYDVGAVPTIMDVINIYGDKGVMVGVRSIGAVGEDEIITIQGDTASGHHALSYEFAQKKKCNCIQAVEDEDAPAVRTIQGLRIKLTNKFEFIDNVKLTSITAIHKTITRCPIEVVVIDGKGNGYIVARLNPWDTESVYRKFYVPNGCRNSVHGLFKIAEQPEIIDDSQPIIISHREALLSLAKGIDLKYFKEQISAGTEYLDGGVRALNDQLAEKKSPIEFPIQVVGMYAGEDIPGIMKW